MRDNLLNIFCKGFGINESRYESFDDMVSDIIQTIEAISQEDKANDNADDMVRVAMPLIDVNTPRIGSSYPFGGLMWRILDVQDGMALLLCNDILEEQRFHKKAADRIRWEQCTLRKYLNSKFLDTFNEIDRARIVKSKINNLDNLWFCYKARKWDDTVDSVFLLSIDEVDKYFGNSGDYLNKSRKEKTDKVDMLVNSERGTLLSNAYDNERVAIYNGQPSQWWLRTSGAVGTAYVACVEEDGSINIFGHHSCRPYGVRPALWVNMGNNENK